MRGSSLELRGFGISFSDKLRRLTSPSPSVGVTKELKAAALLFAEAAVAGRNNCRTWLRNAVYDVCRNRESSPERG